MAKKINKQSIIVIESSEYREEIENLCKDSIMITMALEFLAGMRIPEAIDLAEWRHESGEPTMHAMSIISDRYRRQGGTQARSIGGPAKALFAIIDTIIAREAELDQERFEAEQDREHRAECRDPWCSCKSDPTA